MLIEKTTELHWNAGTEEAELLVAGSAGSQLHANGGAKNSLAALLVCCSNRV